jgi:circadian clock protein KaiB
MKKRDLTQQRNLITMEAFEASLARLPQSRRYLLRLYITGMTQRSREAFDTIKSICEEHLPGNYDLEVIDIYQHPGLAKEEQIIAVPTLIKILPAPLRRLIGNLSIKDRVLLGLDLRAKSVNLPA